MRWPPRPRIAGTAAQRCHAVCILRTGLSSGCPEWDGDGTRSFPPGTQPSRQEEHRLPPVQTTQRFSDACSRKLQRFQANQSVLSDLRREWSGRWDSNPRPQPWQGCALPLSYARMAPGEPDGYSLEDRTRIPGAGNWSGRWDSNPRPQPWQGCALPLSYARINPVNRMGNLYDAGPECRGPETGAGDGIRTHDPNLGKVVLYP